MPGLCSTIAAFLSISSMTVSGAFVPDFRVRPDDYTVLMAVDAQRAPELKPFQAGAHGKFHITGWTRPEQVLEWEIAVPAEDAYSVNILLRQDGAQALRVEVTGATHTVSGTMRPSLRGWTRQPLDGLLRLPAGKQRLELRARASNHTNSFNAVMFAIELVRPAVRERLHRAALKLRSDARWLQDCRYGLMCHWTSESSPRRGERKPYDQAVREFGVESFAEQVRLTAAGFVVFTTSHAHHFFPAPLASLDQILPGRTARRDLVAELADALGRRGVKLFLYYHLGASSDPEWLNATGFWETDTSRLFNHWTAMIGEAGQRYGERIAGWWFDDGSISYYYRSAPWEQLATAAKSGHAQRLIAFNPWELPSPTEFQDYFCGEGNTDPGMGGLVAVGGDGRISDGPHQGLQACATLITEQDWVHTRKNTDIGPPKWSAPQLAALLNEFIARRNVPIFNLEIYQEGALSPNSVELFRQVASQLTPRR